MTFTRQVARFYPSEGDRVVRALITITLHLEATVGAGRTTCPTCGCLLRHRAETCPACALAPHPRKPR